MPRLEAGGISVDWYTKEFFSRDAQENQQEACYSERENRKTRTSYSEGAKGRATQAF